MDPTTLVICEHCDSVYERAALRRGQIADCSRCGCELYRNNHFDLDVMLALALASLFVLLIANLYPLMEVEIGGTGSEATLWKIILITAESKVGVIAVITAACLFFFPLLQTALYLYVLIPLLRGRVPPAFAGAMHALRQMQPWSMVEVFVLGLLVSVVKLSAVAAVTLDVGLWGFGALTILLTALSSFDLHELWQRATELGA